MKIPAKKNTLIFGDSGCGKSTLLSLIAGVLTGHRGNLSVLGVDYAGMSAPQHDLFRAKNIGVIFQQFNLISYLTVIENILLGLKLAGKTADYPRIESILSHLQIDAFRNTRARFLSHGQQQRVAAARALAARNSLILADEPTSALDDTNSRLFLDLLFREAAANETTVVVVSHDLRYKNRFDHQIDLTRVNRAARGAA
ncbi:MAG: ATP-binding cassette domain-containing protein [Spirochaetes bacterium]|nr:ATP-binding cassette domain-containing protein [Spirochaetota bacterium]